MNTVRDLTYALRWLTRLLDHLGVPYQETTLPSPSCSIPVAAELGDHRFIQVIDSWSTVAMETQAKYGTCAKAMNR